MPLFKRTKVFLSYSHSDRQQVTAIHQFLPASVFEIYFDRSRLYPGWQWEPALLKLIHAADVCVVLVGADTTDRDYVNKEIDTFLTAHEGERASIVPVLIDGCDQIPNRLASFQALDLRGTDTDAATQARLISQIVHGAAFLPEAEWADAERGLSNVPEEQDDSFRAKLESGDVGMAPKAMAAMINLGIATTGISCAHRELDLATMGAKQCPEQVVAVCMACLTGACEDSYHAWGRFCTLLPPGDLYTLGTKLFYWCSMCRGPICVHCLGIEDDYPCPSEQVLSFRFRCPVCNNAMQVVPVLNGDMERATIEFFRWVHASGPPNGNA